jgi:hypothetical protein
MKRMFVALLPVLLVACNNEKTAEPTTTAAVEVRPNVPANMHGFTPTYSVSFVMDSAANTETVLALRAEFKGGDLQKPVTFC